MVCSTVTWSDQSQVSVVELQHLMLNVGETVTEEQVEAMLIAVDTDGDRELDFDEFFAVMTGAPPPPELSLLRRPRLPCSVLVSAASTLTQLMHMPAPLVGELSDRAHPTCPPLFVCVRPSC